MCSAPESITLQTYLVHMKGTLISILCHIPQEYDTLREAYRAVVGLSCLGRYFSSYVTRIDVPRKGGMRNKYCQ